MHVLSYNTYTFVVETETVRNCIAVPDLIHNRF